GKGTSVSWPTGLGAKGNEGVTGLIKQTAGAIGYVELVYANQNKLPVATIKNKAGEFVTPSPAAVTAAAEASLATIPPDMRVSIETATGKTASPISSFTYILVYEEQVNAEKGKVLVDFLYWATHAGQKLCEPLGYAALPAKLVPKVEQAL